MSDLPSPSRSASDHAGAVARHVVHVTAQYTGRGPTRARAVFGQDVITVLLQDSFSKGELSLVAAGQAEVVLATRRAYREAMREALIAGVEEITGRTVSAFLSDHHAPTDSAVDVYVLEPLESPPLTDEAAAAV